MNHLNKKALTDIVLFFILKHIKKFLIKIFGRKKNKVLI